MTHFGTLTGSWNYNIVIYNKTAAEKGSPGQGLLDNVYGECRNYAVQPHVDPLGYDPQTHALTSYDMSFFLPASLPDTDCVQTAIQKAEHQTLICER